MHILLLSPYDALSHRTWRERLVAAFAEHTWQVCHLPARYFSWRSRGNSLSWASAPALDGKFDLIIATSMTDLSALKGFRQNLQGVPAILYFHENQFAYPDRGNPAHLVERQVTSLYAALSADRLLFNSEFNRRTFQEGVSDLLLRLPDGVPDGIPTRLAALSRVISVPVPKEIQAETETLFTIVWNHRWEYDKGLDTLLAVVKRLATSGLPIRFHLVGQGFRKVPSEISSSQALLHSAGMLGEFGFVENRGRYLQLLANAHLVFSTALQEFQGLAVMEAVAAGCVPVVPDSLAYQEFFSPEWRFSGVDEATAKILALYQQHQEGVLVCPGLPSAVAPSKVTAAWREVFKDIGL